MSKFIKISLGHAGQFRKKTKQFEIFLWVMIQKNNRNCGKPDVKLLENK